VVANVAGRAGHKDDISFLNGRHGWQWVMKSGRKSGIETQCKVVKSLNLKTCCREVKTHIQTPLYRQLTSAPRSDKVTLECLVTVNRVTYLLWAACH
jgi:hypothetical protein